MSQDLQYMAQTTYIIISEILKYCFFVTIEIFCVHIMQDRKKLVLHGRNRTHDLLLALKSAVEFEL